MKQNRGAARLTLPDCSFTLPHLQYHCLLVQPRASAAVESDDSILEHCSSSRAIRDQNTRCQSAPGCKSGYNQYRLPLRAGCDASRMAGTLLGIALAVLAAFFNGTFGVLPKFEAVHKANVSPLHFNAWVSVGLILSSLPLLAVRQVRALMR